MHTNLNVFFSYLHENNPIFAQKEIRDITLDDLEKLRPTDIEEYLEYLQAYTNPQNEGSNNTKTNHELGLKRSLLLFALSIDILFSMKILCITLLIL